MNIFDLPELPLTEELTTVLAENNNVRIERINKHGSSFRLVRPSGNGICRAFTGQRGY